MTYKEIDIDKATCNIDDILIMEKGTDPDIVGNSYVLLDWSEVGLFDSEFKNPVYVQVFE
tara:strand:+ start:6064 stop:6243 length:180 start_codon:yes stop_codon:yes gene_type:complete